MACDQPTPSADANRFRFDGSWGAYTHLSASAGSPGMGRRLGQAGGLVQRQAKRAGISGLLVSSSGMVPSGRRA